VRARRLTLDRGGHRVGLAVPEAAVARFPQRGHVIDVYTQLQHALGLWFRGRALRNPNI